MKKKDNKIPYVTIIHFFNPEKEENNFKMVVTEDNPQKAAEDLAAQGHQNVHYQDYKTSTRIDITAPSKTP